MEREVIEKGPYRIVKWADGDEMWYYQGKLHREDGPAVVVVEYGTNEWYIQGKRHREDGPAIEYPNGNKEWYIKGELVYNNLNNYLKYYNHSEEFKMSIIKYELQRK